MPTSFADQFLSIDAAAPPPVGTAVTFASLTITDQNDDGDFDRFNNDSVNGLDIRRSWPGDTITLNVPGIGNVTYTGTTFELQGGSVVFTPTDGQVLMNGTFVSSTAVNTQGPMLVSELGPPCFTSGTLIATPRGLTPVERLGAGDLVDTLDHGARPIRWAGACVVDGRGRHAPVVFEAGILRNDRPLAVSPQHRVLWTGARCEVLFAHQEVLVRAISLAGRPGIWRRPQAWVAYHHFMFDRHEIVLANGAPTESLHPGGQHVARNPDLRSELAEFFPDGPALADAPAVRLARPALSGFEARLLAQAI